MTKGGRRSGAGRPKGSPNKNQALLREYAQKIACGEGLDSPLNTILETMRYLHRMALALERDNSVIVEGVGEGAKTYTALQLRMLAVEAATKAAPFVHPRLASVESSMTGRVHLYEASLLELANEPTA